MFRHLTDALIAWGPAGILLLAILDSSGVPVAGIFDAFLILIAVERPSLAWICAALAVIGSSVGSAILFWTARKGGGRFADNAAPGGRAARFREWFRRYGLVTVFVPALMPIPMPLKLFVVSAGVMGTGFGEFIAVILTARILRYGGEAWLGIRLGRESTHFLTGHVWYFLAGAVALFLILYGFIRMRDRGPRLTARP